jgi:hypothetical protein
MVEEAYGKAARKKMQVYVWYKCFLNAHVSVNDYLSFMRPSKTNSVALNPQVNYTD